jgi:hypothetical protein
LNNERKTCPSGVLANAGGDLALELLDLLVERLDRRDHAQDERPAGGQLELADPRDRGAAELCQKLRGLLATGVALARQERLQTRRS